MPKTVILAGLIRERELLRNMELLQITAFGSSQHPDSVMRLMGHFERQLGNLRPRRGSSAAEESQTPTSQEEFDRMMREET